MRFGLSSFFIIFFCLLSSAGANDLASDRLLEILERKGYINEDEVAEVEELLKKEKAKEMEVVYEEGLHLRKKDRRFDIRVGGLVQTDMRLFDHNYPVENEFDIRRARILMEGKVFDYFRFKLEGELEGSQHRRLVDGYVGFDYSPFLKLKAGQFKEPFSLEHLTIDKNIEFMERSMAFHLTPKRDIGLMVHGGLPGDEINYSIGIFSGHGRDESGGDVGEDDKDICARLTLKPFQWTGKGFLSGFHIGGSFSHAHLKTSDMDFGIETGGFTEFLRVTPRAKFYLVFDVDDRRRFGWELAWSLGPLIFKGEWIRNDYHDIELSSGEEFDLNMEAWYLSGLVMLTGEHLEIKRGVFIKIRPERDFNFNEGGWGALGLAFRLERFDADRIIYDHLVDEDYFVRGADAYTLALNWYLNSMVWMSVGFSHYGFFSPLYLGTDEQGRTMYSNDEDLFAARFQVEF
ncbi:MAG: porin [Thermodesulfobacteriota bacterium]|nr:porin [Thermodesulfobacteriota bacterium]